jgi:hypothetical protein
MTRLFCFEMVMLGRCVYQGGSYSHIIRLQPRFLEERTAKLESHLLPTVKELEKNGQVNRNGLSCTWVTESNWRRIYYLRGGRPCRITMNRLSTVWFAWWLEVCDYLAAA